MRRWVWPLAAVLVACSGTPSATTDEIPIISTVNTGAIDSTTSSTAARVPFPGEPGIGDSLHPSLGNGGYDVDHYALDLTFDGDRLEGTATLIVRPTVLLESFYLDLTGMAVASVTVDGTNAAFEVQDELRVIPDSPLDVGSEASVVIEYGGVPASIPNVAGQFRVGWHESVDSWFGLSEPAGADTWFPSNNHPLDKATFELRMAVPTGLTVVSSGTLTDESSQDGLTTFTWESTDPIAPYLVGLGIGEFDRATEESSGGVEINNYFDTDLPAAERAKFERQGEMMDFFTEVLGPYPFAEYGALVLETNNVSAALETQTRPTYGTQILVLGEAVVAHELAHQWFGDSLSVSDWSDVWLNEGFSTYLQWLWAGYDRGEAALTGEVVSAYRALAGVPLVQSAGSEEAAYEQALSQNPPPGTPPADDLFNQSVYVRGALTIHALRLQLGDDVFFSLLKTWTTSNQHGNVSTDQFLQLVDEVGGTDARVLVERWIFDREMPPIEAMDLAPPG